MKILEKILIEINKLIEVVAMIIVVIMVIVVGAQVFWRYVLSNSLSWSEEMARYLFVWLTFLGSEITLRRKGHIAFDSIVKLFRGIRKKYIYLLVDFLVILFAIIVFRSGIKLTIATWNQPSPAMGLSLGYVYMAVPISMGMIIVNTINEIITKIRDIKFVAI